MTVAPEIESYLASLTPEDPPPERGGAEVAEKPPARDRIADRFIETVVLGVGARRVLEIGAADGRSALRLARRLPEHGSLFSIESEPRRAAAARRRLAEAGFGERAHVIVGDPARMVHKVAGPFDVVLDAGHRRRCGPLLDRLVALLRPGGTLITVDVLGAGGVVPGVADPPDLPADDTEAVAEHNRRLAADARLVTAFLPVGAGLAVSVKAR